MKKDVALFIDGPGMFFGNTDIHTITIYKLPSSQKWEICVRYEKRGFNVIERSTHPFKTLKEAVVFFNKHNKHNIKLLN